MLFCATGLWAQTLIDGIYYKFDENTQTATVTNKIGDSSGSNSYSGSITIPSTVAYNGTSYSVTSIGDYAFYRCTGLTNITIPNGVTKIGNHAFYYCSGLTSVTIPNSVTSIEIRAFSGCGNLVYNTSGNAKYLGNDANPYLYLYAPISQDITSCEINESCKIIADYAFNNCRGLTSVTIPNSVASIRDYAFNNCSNLTNITIGENVTSIGESAFSGCDNLVYNTSGNAKYLGNNTNPYLYLCTPISQNITSCGINENCKIIADNAFYRCSELASVTIPNSVTSIGEKAFYNCSKITSITIPNSVTSIGSSAFDRCSGLTSVKVVVTDCSVFCNNDLTYRIGLPVYLIDKDGNEIKEIVIPNDVTNIGDYAFYGCSRLTSIMIPNSVTSIGSSAFYDCTGLASVTIPNSVTSIGSSAFYNCSNIETADINSQAALDVISFTDKLTSINLGSGITNIRNRAFYKCTGLTSITIPNSVMSIGGSAFQNCIGLKNVTIVEGLTDIDDDAFSGCSELTNIEIPNSVTRIGKGAFSGCDNLVYNTYDNAKYLGNSGDPYMHLYKAVSQDITSCKINENCKFITYYAFEKCAKLTSITIPKSVTSIEDYAFYQCTGLTNVTIGEGVASIGSCAFSKCTSLTRVNIQSSVASFENYVFSGCSNLTNIIVPCGEYDYFKNAISQYASIIYENCTFEITTNVNNENYGTVTNGGIFLNETIQLTATPNDHYHFVKWNDGNTDNPRTVQVTQDSTFTAVFAIDEHNVTISKNISAAGTVTGDGNYEYGTNITLTAIPNAHYLFVNWSDGDTENPRTVKVTQDSTFTAIFEIDEHNVIISKNLSAGGTVAGEGVYKHGTSITLTATPSEHYHFVKWYDGSTQNSRTVQVTQDSTFTAIFAIDEHNVTLSKNISAAGTVTGDGVYEYGTNITLTATPNEGYRFKGWSDGAIGKSRELTVTKDIDLIANFVPLYTLKTLASASQGSVSGGGIYEDGEVATLVANAKPGYVFAQWADGNDENPRYVTVDGNKTYTAIFIEGEQDKYMITWKNWDGRVIKTSEVSYGEVPVFNGEKPTRPDEAGYTFTFNGWSPTIAAASQNAEYTAKYIQTATEAEKTTIENEGDISITITDNTALFTWPENASADTYTLTITRNDEVFCSLTFDGQGRLINLNFPNLRASAEGYRFTVTGLNSGTDYAYDLKAKNGAATVSEYTGEFRTSGDAATAAPEAEESIVETARYDINGRPLNAPMKGVNIVKYSDGSFEKEFVR